MTAIASELTSLCKQVQDTEQAQLAALQDYHSAALSSALLSEGEFWLFIADPATPYLDRMAAARDGGKLISPEQLPRLWSTVAGLKHLSIGVNPSPCDFLMSANLGPRQWASRRERPLLPPAANQAVPVILGRTIKLPMLVLDYPLSREQQDNAPWLWQMQRALPVLLSSVNQYYAEPDRYPAMAEAAWQWEPSDWYQASMRVDALLRGPRDAAWVARNVGVALGEHHPELAARALGGNVWGSDSYHFEELVHAAQIVVLQRTGEEQVATQTADWAARLASDDFKSFSPVLKPLRSATAILAIARWATDEKLSKWNRYSSFATAVCQMLDEPPFIPNLRLPSDDPELAASLSRFEAWLARERPRLEQQAGNEWPHLNGLASEIHQTIIRASGDEK